MPIDWFHNECVENDVLDMYWSQPTITVQGSLDGSFPSLIDQKKTGQFRSLAFKIHRFYKRLIYNFR